MEDVCSRFRADGEHRVTPRIGQGRLADRLLKSQVILRIDSQVQGHHTVATIGSSENLLIVATGLIDFVIPGVAAAVGSRDLLGDVILDGQVQRHDAVAAVGGREGTCVITAGRVGLVNPRVAVAVHNVNGLDHRLLDGQVQRHYAVAAIGSREGLCIIAAGGIDLAVPLIADTVGSGEFVQHLVQDGQVQGDDTIAAGGSAFRNTISGVVGALRIGDTVPRVAVASRDNLRGDSRVASTHLHSEGGRNALAVVFRRACHRIGVTADGRRCDRDGRGGFTRAPNIGGSTGSRQRDTLKEGNGCITGNRDHRNRVNRQVQGIHLRATVGILMRIGVGAALRVLGVVVCHPGVTATSRLGEGSVRRIMDGQMQRHHTVATRCRRQGLLVVAAGRINLVVPSIAFASRDRKFIGNLA